MTTTDTPPAPTARAVVPAARPRIDFADPEYRRLVRALCCTDQKNPRKSATDDEFSAFMGYCERVQLDPLAKQVYFFKRGRDDDENSRGAPELSIDAYRLIAERTGDYCGQTPRQWARVRYNGGEAHIEWYEVWPFKSETPYAARVGVYRVGFSEPLVAVARYEAYVQTTRHNGQLKPNRMWEKMGPEQLGKCAEALALRQAFPNELGGVYTTDEMGQADQDGDEPAPTTNGRGATRARNSNADRPRRAAPPAAAPPPPATSPAPAAEPAQPALHVYAIPADDRREAREAGVTWFPYGELSYVPLKMTWPDGEHAGAYVVSDELLAEAEQRLSEMHERATKAGDTARATKLTNSLNWIAAEMTRRAETATEAAQPAPASV